MAEVPIASLKAVSRELYSLGIGYAFTGGSIVGLLLDVPDVAPIRPTDDVDVIIEVLSRGDYSKLEERLRKLGFSHDVREGAPMCRWIFRRLTVDIMPVRGDFLGLNTAWFDHALAGAVELDVGGEPIRVVSPPAFLATKLAAFSDRGCNDFRGSHDLEDLLAVVDGRDAIVDDVDDASEPLRTFVADTFSEFLRKRQFLECLSGHLPPDAGSQARVPSLEEKLRRIAGLARGKSDAH